VSSADVVFVGSPEDARGFRLAGVAAVAATRDAIDRAAAAWLAEAARPALLIVSPEALAMARDTLEALEKEPGGTIVIVLPEGP
jgi:vacuolar-type H+-ATPase subunit F/Vma7